MAKSFPLSNVNISALAAIYNSVAEAAGVKTVTRFSDRAAAEKRTEAALKTAGKTLIEHDGSWKLVDASKPISSGQGSATSAFPDASVIKVLAEANPKRAGSAAAARFALYKSGQTVGEYRKAVKALQPDFDSLKDLRWDVEHGHISVAAKGARSAQ